MLDLVAAELSSEERALLLRPEVGGVIFFARNIVSQQQISDLTTEITELRPELLLAVDQEGGRVQRLRDGYSLLPAMQVLGDYYQKDEDAGAQLLRDTGWLMAVEVIASGLDFSFAPVLDLDRRHCPVIADRAFSDDAQLATQAIRFFIEGMHEAGMAATGKHFPGHGGVLGDSHLETPCDLRDIDELRDHDLRPFRELASDLQGVMPAHIVFPNISDQPVGFSSFWLQQVLREELGFQGVIFSDDLSMKGADVVGSYQQKAAAALAAGCDMVLVCNNRAGAITVMDFLAKRHSSGDTSCLATMKAKRRWTWAELEQSARRQAVVDTLNRVI